MGLEPNEDVGTVILDPNFATGIPWTITSPWQRIANRADYDANRAGFGVVTQTNIATLQGGEHSLTFTMGNANFGGGRGVEVKMNGIGDGIKYNSNGAHTAEIFTPFETSILQFIVIPKVAGDKCWIDTLSIILDGNYVIDQLGIDWPGARKYEFLNVGGGRYNQTCAARNGKTNCLIAFDV